MAYKQSQERFPQQATSSPVDEARLKKILAGDMEELNNYASQKAEQLVQGKESEKLSTSQIRSVLDEIQRMAKYDKNKLQILRLKLAYAAGRHGGRVKELQSIVDKAIQFTNQDNFEHFKNLIEAIVAYHRYHGGK